MLYKVREHISSFIKLVVDDWGFKYLKLDFLYSAALGGTQNCMFDRTMTKAQVRQY